MDDVKGLVTFVEVDPREPGRAFHARLDVVLGSGGRLTLLDDRGWAGGRIEDWTIAEVESTARTVVGPDEPLASRGETQQLMTESHRRMLQRKLTDAGVDARGFDFHALPHDVQLGQRLRDRLKSEPAQPRPTTALHPQNRRWLTPPSRRFRSPPDCCSRSIAAAWWRASLWRRSRSGGFAASEAQPSGCLESGDRLPDGARRV